MVVTNLVKLGEKLEEDNIASLPSTLHAGTTQWGRICPSGSLWQPNKTIRGKMISDFNFYVGLGVIISLQYSIIFKGHCPDLDYFDSWVLSYNKYPALPAR